MVNKLSEQGMAADEAELALHLFDQQEEKVCNNVVYVFCVSFY